MAQKILISLLIGFAGFIVWYISLWFLPIDQDLIFFLWTGLLMVVIWILTRKIFKNVDSKAEEDK